MNQDACFKLGTLVKAHGLRGEVLIHLDVDIPENYQDLESVFVEVNQQLIPFFVSNVLLQKGSKAIVSLDEIDSIEDVERVKGCGLWLPLSFLPQLENNQYYYHEVIGYEVVDDNHGLIGLLTGFNESGPQTIMMVEHKGKEVLVPVSEQTVQGPDHAAKAMKVSLPDGLLEIYMEDQ